MPRRQHLLSLLLLCIFLASLFILGILIESTLYHQKSSEHLAHSVTSISTNQALTWFTLMEIARAKEFGLARLRHYLNLQILNLSFLGFLIVSLSYQALWKAAKHTNQFLPRLKFSKPAYVVFFFLLFWIIRFPEEFYGNFLLEKAYGLSEEKFWSWFSQSVKGKALILAIAVPFYLGFLRIFQKYPKRWFIPATFIVWTTSVLLITFSPLILDPLFHEFKPLPQNALATRLNHLTEQAGIPPTKIFVMDASRRTNRTNAYFAGIGPTQRIVLYDTLLASSSPDEVESILAHEIGHWRHHHILKGMALLLPGLLLVFWLCSLLLNFLLQKKFLYTQGHREALLLPLLVVSMLLLSYLGKPIVNAVSRQFESQADLTALSLIQNPETFIASEVEVTRKNLIDIVPQRLYTLYFSTHPTPLQRLQMATSFAKRMKPN